VIAAPAPTLGQVASELPLFPLGTVLFPGLRLPLHVFEDRYRLLVRELVDRPEGEPRRFGVVAIRAGVEVGDRGVQELHDVGCTAEVREVSAYDDGRYDVVVTGGTRFRLLEVSHHRPYATGEVELLPEPIGDVAQARVATARVRRRFSRYLDALGRARGADIDVPDLPDDPLVLSYLVAATVLADVPARQKLLASPDAVSRLAREDDLLRSETALLQLLGAVPAGDLLRDAPPSVN
jgi:Lon protease-like protein